MNILQFFYVSRVVVPCATDAIQGILKVSRRNNARDDLTGCLLFSGSYFAQVLEGRRDVVSSRVQRIQADPRHRDVRLLVERSVQARSYANWSMGYLHNLSLEDELEAMLVDPVPRLAMTEVMDRMRPDTVMGALA